MYSDVVDYVRSCEDCQRIKKPQKTPPGPLGRRIIEHPWCIISTDVMDFPRSRAGYNHLIVFQDLFTKWIEFKPLRKVTGETIREAFKELILTSWGSPRVLISDNATPYVSRILNDLITEYGIHHSKSPIYRAAANPTERSNRTLKSMIKIYLEQDHRVWDKHLNDFRFVYNTAKSSVFSPAFLNFGREPLLSNSLKFDLESTYAIEGGNVQEWADKIKKLNNLKGWVTQNLEEAHDRQAKYYNAKHKPIVYQLGDLVLLKNRILSSAAKKFSSKLAKTYKGPYKITKIVSPLVYNLTISDGDEQNNISIVDLKKFIERSSKLD